MVAGVLWLTAIGVLTAVRILISIPAFRRAARAWSARLRDRLVAWFDPPSNEDQDQLAFSAAIHRDQLRGHLLRVERLLADDSWMPGTRQTGNRLAYAWLIGELKRVNATLDACGYLETPVPAWDPAPAPLPRSRQIAYAPRVEVLEISGWR